MGGTRFFSSSAGTARRLGLLGGLTLAVTLASSSSALAASTIFVDGTEPGGGACGAASDPCKTITQGITNAVPGDTVRVAPGTYTEQLVINKPLTLRGASLNTNAPPQDQTIVASPSVASGLLVDKFGADDNRPVIYVNNVAAPNVVDIQGIKVAGNEEGRAGFTFYGIAYVNAGGTVSDVRLTHIRNEPLDNQDTGVGIYNSNDGNPRSFQVLDSSLSDYQRTGIRVTGSNLTVSLSGNTLTGIGLNAHVPQTGIQVDSGTAATILRNNISAHKCDTASATAPTCVSDLLRDTSDISPPGAERDQGAGIRLGVPPAGATGPVTIGTSTSDGNTVSGNDVGLLDRFNTATVNATGNNFNNNRYAQIFIHEGRLNAKANNIDGNLTGGGNADAGVAIASKSGFFAPTVTLTGNTIRSSTIGVKVFSDGLTAAPSATLHYNRISGNTSRGLTNETAAMIDAENNWWGCNLGPEASSGCDHVLNASTGTLDDNPWLVLSVRALPQTVIAGGFSNVIADFHNNSDGNPVGASFPQGTNVVFGETFAQPGVTIQSPKPTSNLAQALSLLSTTQSASMETASATASLDSQTVASPNITVLAAGRCHNTQTGTTADDNLVGTPAGDALHGLAGDDLLQGLAGKDCLFGEAGDDRLEGGPGNDNLYGGAGIGADQLIGGAGKDEFLAGQGPDSVNSRDGVAEVVNCGHGVDRAKADVSDTLISCEVVLP